MDLIVEVTNDFEHCEDDAIFWDDNIQDNFFSVCQFLEKCSDAGCVFNPKKFSFGEESVVLISICRVFNLLKSLFRT